MHRGRASSAKRLTHGAVLADTIGMTALEERRHDVRIRSFRGQARATVFGWERDGRPTLVWGDERVPPDLPRLTPSLRWAIFGAPDQLARYEGRNVWLGTTITSQKEHDAVLPALLRCRVPVHFVVIPAYVRPFETIDRRLRWLVIEDSSIRTGFGAIQFYRALAERRRLPCCVHDFREPRRWPLTVSDLPAWEGLRAPKN